MATRARSYGAKTRGCRAGGMFFFFQAEDGIRDDLVTGVQTCALPISLRREQDGQLPARTVYGITAEGHRELRVLRAEALQEVRLQPDPVDLALAMSREIGRASCRERV